VASVEFYWSTQDNQSIDRVPYIGPIGPNSTHVFVATGFGGWGMTNGTAAGIILSDLILGKANPWADIFSPQRFKPVSSAKQLVVEGLDTAKELVSNVLPKPGTDKITLLLSGEGKVFNLNHERVAVVKDGNGDFHGVSAICTHMGCKVSWNNGEQSWDCPCHGSRFDINGKVLHGPAVTDLEDKTATLTQNLQT
jgi:Rieske Fe-S protein